MNVGDLDVIVRPKIPVDRVMFLITYAMDPKGWRDHTIDLAPDDDVLEAVALTFARRTHQAIGRGLLRGYRRREEALNTVRGRIRFGDQIGRRFGLPLPIEVSCNEYTEDIEQNRLLKTAIDILAHTLIRSDATRRELRGLQPAFDMVRLGTYARGAVPEIRYTRLDEHYRPAVELARLIIENSSLELFAGKVAGAAFLINMNRVFEQFLYVALGEALELSRSTGNAGKPFTWTRAISSGWNPTSPGGHPVPSRENRVPSSWATPSTRNWKATVAATSPISYTPISTRFWPTARRPTFPTGYWSTLREKENRAGMRSSTPERRSRWNR